MNIIQVNSIANDFDSHDSGSYYVYVFLGRVLDAQETHVLLDGELVQDDWWFNVDYDDINSICYVGKGKGRRHLTNTNRKITPPAKNRIKVKEGLTSKEALTLESTLIKKAGLFLNKSGCLVNLYGPGERIQSELMKRIFSDAQLKGQEAVKRILVMFDQSKTILFKGCPKDLAEKLNLNPDNLSHAASRPNQSRTKVSALGTYLYVCYEDDFNSFVVPALQINRDPSAELKLIKGVCKATNHTITGTASELKKLLGFRTSGVIHTIASPSSRLRTHKGWTFEYI